jgi:ubiquinone/menaquinone biosynthesis C-methylase UbiE
MDTPTKQPTPAEKWDGLYSKGAAYKPLSPLLLKAILDRAEQMTGHRPDTALDLGCGTGDSMSKLKAAGLKQVSGIDCSAVALDEARQANPDCDLTVADLNELQSSDFANRKFDLVMCKLTVAFLKDKAGFLAAAKGMLTDDGILCVITPVLHEGIEYAKEDKPGIAVDYRGFSRLLNENFGEVTELHHDYFGDKGDTVTFLAKS